MLPPIPPSPFALFLDVDGTLIDIAPRPDAVFVPPALRQALAILDDHLGGAIALVSGRTIADLDRLFEPLRLRASGVHGAEIRWSRSGAIESLPEALLPTGVMTALDRLAGRYPGTLLENKSFSAAIHYRAVPDVGPRLAEELQALVASLAVADLVILPGHMVFEVKRATFDKGKAISRFLASETFAGRTPVFVGDDVTDEPGFEAVRTRGGLAYSVGAMRPQASAAFNAPDQVRAWLARLAQDLAPSKG
jgi:trehalose 6-phosphate phosphatase